MESIIFFLFLGVIILMGVWAYARRGTFVSACGISLLLISPLLTQWLNPLSAYFDTWLWTFRLIALCVFVWGIIENLTEAFRPTP